MSAHAVRVAAPIAAAPRELDPVKIAAMNAINLAHAAGHRLVIVDIARGRARTLIEGQLDAATGFGGLFEDEGG